MKFEESSSELRLERDAEVNAVNYLAKHAIKTLDNEQAEIATKLTERISDIIMGDPLGSFEKPSVLLNPAETKMILDIAYNYATVTDGNRDHLFPNTRETIDELAELADKHVL